MVSFSEIRLGEINAKEDLSLRLGDALDMKASISLAVIVFLATQSAYFFDKRLPHLAFCIQAVSVICVALAAIFAVIELWPVTYGLPAPESSRIPQRLQELREHYRPYANAEENSVNAIIEDEIAWAIERIGANDTKNIRKSNALAWSFWFTAAAMFLNLVTVIIFLIRPTS